MLRIKVKQLITHEILAMYVFKNAKRKKCSLSAQCFLVYNYPRDPAGREIRL